jgi:hypothetical protein
MSNVHKKRAAAKAVTLDAHAVVVLVRTLRNTAQISKRTRQQVLSGTTDAVTLERLAGIADLLDDIANDLYGAVYK